MASAKSYVVEWVTSSSDEGKKSISARIPNHIDDRLLGLSEELGVSKTDIITAALDVGSSELSREVGMVFTTHQGVKRPKEPLSINEFSRLNSSLSECALHEAYAHYHESAQLAYEAELERYENFMENL